MEQRPLFNFPELPGKYQPYRTQMPVLRVLAFPKTRAGLERTLVQMNDARNVGSLRTPPLPATVTDLMAQRKSMRARTLNDDVEDIHLRLWEDQDYREYLWPIWREDTVEGSFIADDLSAAGIIRRYAREHDVPLAARAKLHSIMRSLHVVCRRYGVSRRERQNLINGEPAELTTAAD